MYSNGSFLSLFISSNIDWHSSFIFNRIVGEFKRILSYLNII
jgi:hypothetical protein